MKEVKVGIGGMSLGSIDTQPSLLIMEKDGERHLHLVIGILEASSILMAMEGVAPSRPITHDLLNNVITKMGGHVDRVVIKELREETYHASIFLDEPWEMEIDCRPSDGIALALRVGAPLFVKEEVLEEVVRRNERYQQEAREAAEKALLDESDPGGTVH